VGVLIPKTWVQAGKAVSSSSSTISRVISFLQVSSAEDVGTFVKLFRAPQTFNVEHHAVNFLKDFY